jgi:large subunit ribosomal protein L10
MSKFVKDLITRELRSRYGSIDSAIWVEMIGVDGITTNEFRRELRRAGMRLEVIRNSLFKRAVADRPLGKLAEALEGPAALVTGGDSIIDVARFLEEWLPKIKGLRIRGAVLEGEYLDERAAAGLSKLPTKRDLRARLVSSLLAPGSQLAGVLLSAQQRVAGCLQSLIEKFEKEQAPANVG